MGNAAATGCGNSLCCLANNCDDDSAARARRFAHEHPGLMLHVAEVTLPADLSHIGHVRRCLMDEACRRLDIAGCGERAIASTDGDTRVAPSWLENTLNELRLGVDAVGGRIVTDATDTPSPTALRLQWVDMAYALLRLRLASLVDPDPLDPWPRHHQHFGASLAVSARAYRAAGGVPDVPYLEDEALVRALRRVDMRVRHSPAVRVTTSGRLVGRAPVGLSWQLRQWAESPHDLAGRLVESPSQWVKMLSARRRLRSAWQMRHHESLASALLDPACTAVSQLGLDESTLLDIVGSAQYFGAAWEIIDSRRQSAAGPDDRVPLHQALAELRVLVRRLPTGPKPRLIDGTNGPRESPGR